MALLLHDLAKSSAVFLSYNKHIIHKLIPTNRLQYNVSTHRNQCTYTVLTNSLEDKLFLLSLPLSPPLKNTYNNQMRWCNKNSTIKNNPMWVCVTAWPVMFKSLTIVCCLTESILISLNPTVPEALTKSIWRAIHSVSHEQRLQVQTQLSEDRVTPTRDEFYSIRQSSSNDSAGGPYRRSIVSSGRCLSIR